MINVILISLYLGAIGGWRWLARRKDGRHSGGNQVLGASTNGLLREVGHQSRRHELAHHVAHVAAVVEVDRAEPGVQRRHERLASVSHAGQPFLEQLSVSHRKPEPAQEPAIGA